VHWHDVMKTELRTLQPVPQEQAPYSYLQTDQVQYQDHPQILAFGPDFFGSSPVRSGLSPARQKFGQQYEQSSLAQYSPELKESSTKTVGWV
jgi:hypothetical protein